MLGSTDMDVDFVDLEAKAGVAESSRTATGWFGVWDAQVDFGKVRMIFLMCTDHQKFLSDISFEKRESQKRHVFLVELFNDCCALLLGTSARHPAIKY